LEQVPAARSPNGDITLMQKVRSSAAASLMLAGVATVVVSQVNYLLRAGSPGTAASAQPDVRPFHTSATMSSQRTRLQSDVDEKPIGSTGQTTTEHKYDHQSL
jgi:hypothetical protein